MRHVASTAHLTQLATVEHHDPFGHLHGREIVRDQRRNLADPQLSKPQQDQVLLRGVER